MIPVRVLTKLDRWPSVQRDSEILRQRILAAARLQRPRERLAASFEPGRRAA